MSEVITVEKAAKDFDVTNSTIYNWLKSGKLNPGVGVERMKKKGRITRKGVLADQKYMHALEIYRSYTEIF